MEFTDRELRTLLIEMAEASLAAQEANFVWQREVDGEFGEGVSVTAIYDARGHATRCLRVLLNAKFEADERYRKALRDYWRLKYDGIREKE